MAESNDKVKENQKNTRPLPPGGIKIAQAFKSILSGKEFSDITIEDIVNASGMNSALIYKYYGDKRGLLHSLLSEGMDRYLERLDRELKGIRGALNKLRKLIWVHFNLYREDRVVARILLLEVRNHRSYYESEGYGKMRRYALIMKGIIEEGVRNGEIRSDIPVWVIRQSLMGAIEHLCLPWVVGGREYSEDLHTDHVCELFFGGIQAPRGEEGLERDPGNY